jgi:hypothetical protein
MERGDLPRLCASGKRKPASVCPLADATRTATLAGFEVSGRSPGEPWTVHDNVICLLIYVSGLSFKTSDFSANDAFEPSGVAMIGTFFSFGGAA